MAITDNNLPGNPKVSKMVKKSPAREFNQDIKNKVNPILGRFPLPPVAGYSATWNQGTHTYNTYFDEATHNGSYVNLVAMKRDAFIAQLLYARTMPTAQLNYHLLVDDPDDSLQMSVAEEVEKILQAMPFWTQMLFQITSEGVFGGRAGSQIAWDYRKVDKKDYLIPVNFSAVQTDKIIFDWNGTPGLLTGRAYKDPNANFGLSQRGKVLWLYKPQYRDCFLLFKFMVEDMDFLLEAQQAGARHGLGLRHYAWHTYRELIELKSWLFDALQRVGTSGMLYGYYETGNAQQEEDMVDALSKLCRDNIAVFPYLEGQKPEGPIIHQIEPSRVGYDVLFDAVSHHESILRKLFIGQSLSDSDGATGMGSGVADLHANTLSRIIKFDSQLLAECLNRDLIAVIMKYNFPKADFKVKLEFEHDGSEDMLDKAKTALALHKTGVDLDSQELRDIGGFSEPGPGDEIPGGEATGDRDLGL